LSATTSVTGRISRGKKKKHRESERFKGTAGVIDPKWPNGKNSEGALTGRMTGKGRGEGKDK